MNITTVHIVDLRHAVHESHLTPEEQARASRFRFDRDAARWTSARSALRLILGARCRLPPSSVPITTGPHGKPRLSAPFDDVHFNISHCHDLALIAVAPFPVGIDLEPADRAQSLPGCESSFCHASEIAALPSPARLLEIWTAKEAALKAHGTGLLIPPHEVEVDFTTPPACARHPRFGAPIQLTRLTHPMLSGHIAWLAAPAISLEIRYLPPLP